MKVATAHRTYSDSLEAGILDSISFALEYSIVIVKRSETNKASSSTSFASRALADPDGPLVMDRAEVHIEDKAVTAPAANRMRSMDEVSLKISPKF